jgi:hypothetical protein
MIVRRVRGALLRLARRRRLSLVAGLAIGLPASWMQFWGRGDAWWAEGLSLVGVALGAALIWTGLVGLRPDWVDR